MKCACGYELVLCNSSSIVIELVSNYSVINNNNSRIIV